MAGVGQYRIGDLSSLCKDIQGCRAELVEGFHEDGLEQIGQGSLRMYSTCLGSIGGQVVERLWQVLMLE